MQKVRKTVYESYMLAAGLPVARPLPSATLHTDLKAARLELLLPSNLELRNASAEPPGALAIATRPPRAAAGLGRAPRVQTRSGSPPLTPLGRLARRAQKSRPSYGQSSWQRSPRHAQSSKRRCVPS